MISVVTPLLNEEDNILALIQGLQEASESVPDSGPFEIIIVDDGSTDRTLELAKQALAEWPRWKVISLTRNFGQQPAYLAGLSKASGDAVVMIDGDLQDPPSLIPQLVAEWKEGAKLVTAVRLTRAESGPRRFAFNTFHTVFDRLTGGLMPKNSGAFGLLDRKIVDQLVSMKETNLFLPALRNWVGLSKAEVYYHREVRSGAPPRQSWTRLVNLAVDGITSFSTVPLRLIGWLGLAISVPSLLWSLWLIIQRSLQVSFGWFPGLEVLGFTTVAVAILLLGGIQLICLGVIGEYLGRIYQEVKRRPPFLIGEIHSSEPTENTSQSST